MRECLTADFHSIHPAVFFPCAAAFKRPALLADLPGAALDCDGST